MLFLGLICFEKMPIVIDIYYGGENMNEMIWFLLHSIMLFALLPVWVITEVVNSGKEIGDSFKNPQNKTKRSISENIVMIIILIAMMLIACWFAWKLLMRNSILSACFVLLYGFVYAYIAVRQMIKIIFCPEKRDFSECDIRNYMLTYMFWWLMLAIMRSPESSINLLNGIPADCKAIVEVILLLLYYYFNILFSLGWIYLLSYYVLKLINALEEKKRLGKAKRGRSLDEIRDMWLKDDKLNGLKSFELWKKHRKCVVYKLLMTVPFFIFDMLNVPWIFLKIVIKTLLIEALKAILSPIGAVCKLVRELWNRYKNNEWMYVFAQIAGLCSYFIVFVIVLYGGFDDKVKRLYEFVGTVILIPYFLDKLNQRKEKNEEKAE